MSLITYPVATDPRAFKPRSVSLSQDVNARSFASPFGGSEQAVDMLNDRWRLSMELPPCTQIDAARREAFINALRGQVNHTELHHFGRPYPQGTLASCQGLVYDAPQGADSITIATTAGATLLAGDMLGVDGLLLQCRADCTANANGVLVVPLTNRLRRAVPGLRRASTATYVDGSGVLQTAAVDVPRFQGGQLLVEVAGTNICWPSNGGAGGWSLLNGGTGVLPVVTNNFAAGPDGLTSAHRVVFDKGSGTASADQSGVQTIFGGTVAGSPTAAAVWIRSNTASSYLMYLDFNGAASNAAGFPSLITVTPAWTRFEIRHSSAADTNRRVVLRLRGSHGTSNFADVLVFGFHQENAASVSSYIPTTTAAATRAADIITPVVWQKPTAPFRLVGRPALRYVPGYSESLALDFVEKVD